MVTLLTSRGEQRAANHHEKLKLLLQDNQVVQIPTLHRPWPHGTKPACLLDAPRRLDDRTTQSAYSRGPKSANTRLHQSGLEVSCQYHSQSSYYRHCRFVKGKEFRR